MSSVHLHPRFREAADRSMERHARHLDEKRAQALGRLRHATDLARGLQARMGSDGLLDPLISELEVARSELEALDVEQPPSGPALATMAERMKWVAESFDILARLAVASGHGRAAAKPASDEGL